MSNLYSRTADDNIYAKENRYNNPKEAFKQIAEILKLAQVKDDKSLLDIGCATGEFLYYVRSLNSLISLKGVEYSDHLIASSRKFLNQFGIDIEQGDANSLSNIKDKTFDYVTQIGVTSIFDDFRPSFKEMIRVTKPEGICLNMMLVNEEDVDVIIRYINPSSRALESGWNKFSLKSIESFLRNNPEVGRFEFIKHKMPFDIERRDDPMRSWTKMINGERVLWNGLNMEIALYYIIFEVKKSL